MESRLTDDDLLSCAVQSLEDRLKVATDALRAIRKAAEVWEPPDQPFKAVVVDVYRQAAAALARIEEIEKSG